MATSTSAQLKRRDLLLPANRRQFIEAAMWVPTKDGQRVRFRLNPTQADLAANQDRLLIIPKARQLGVTTIFAALDLAEALIVPNTHVLFAAQSEEEAVTIGSRFMWLYENMDEEVECADGELDVRPALRRDSLRHLEFANGSTVDIRTANSGRSGRGQTYHRAHGSEVAYWEDESKARQFVAAALGASGGIPRFRGRLESTGNGAQGLFYNLTMAALGRLAVEGDTADLARPWKVRFYGWNEAPEYRIAASDARAAEVSLDGLTAEEKQAIADLGLDDAQLRWWRWTRAAYAMTGSGELFEQEYPLYVEDVFVTRGTVVFTPQLVEAAAANRRPPIERMDGGSLAVWRRPEVGHGYLVVADCSSGTDADPSAFVVLDGRTGAHVASFEAWVRPEELGRLLARTGREYNNAWVVVERNTGYGHEALKTLAREGYRAIYYAPDGKAGWHTDRVNKPAAVSAYIDLMSAGALVTFDERVPQQMTTFVKDSRGHLGSKGRNHDDLLMCLIIGAAVLKDNPALAAAGGGARKWRYR